MLKNKSRYICSSCEFVTLGYLGKCPNCDTWNSFILDESEHNLKNKNLNQVSFNDNFHQEQFDLNATYFDEPESRLTTGFNNLDNVLGGGLVQGSVVLLAGEPGIGKSTLLLQLADNIAKTQNTTYISGEESLKQIGLRAKRLNIQAENLKVLALQNLEEIFNYLNNLNPKIVIIDSIQTIFTNMLSSTPGSIGQVRESANLIIKYAKAKNITVILIGHVTKDGIVAGPKVLEHAVDVVLQFESYNLNNLRVIKSIKNRFGPTSDLVLFSMKTNGLNEVTSPSKFLLHHRFNDHHLEMPAGSVITATGRGANSLLMEVQALATQTFYPNPKRVVNGFDYNRMLQIIAVLEKHVGLNLSKYDVYVNIVGGLDITDTTGDLGVALSIASSYLNQAIAPMAITLGEIGLTGEIRPNFDLSKCLKEAIALGITKAVLPNIQEVNIQELNHQYPQINIHHAKNLKTAFNIIFNQSK